MTTKTTDCTAERSVQLVFIVGPVRELTVAPAPTKDLYRFPLFGEVDVGIKLTATQEVELRIVAKDARGNLASLDGPPVWATDNSDVLALEASSEGLACMVRATGMIGTGRVQVTGDADLGAGVEPVLAIADVEVGPGKAVVIEIESGEPHEAPSQI